MIRDTDRAKDYARGLYAAATDSWLAQLGHVSEALAANPELRLVLGDPSVEFADKAARLSSVLPADADKAIRNFISLLAKNSQVDLLDRVIEEFGRRTKGGTAAPQAEITSAVELTAEEKATVEQRVRAAYGPETEFKYIVNPDILGGLIIRVGDKILDGSVAAKLNRLRDQIISAI